MAPLMQSTRRPLQAKAVRAPLRPCVVRTQAPRANRRSAEVAPGSERLGAKPVIRGAHARAAALFLQPLVDVARRAVQPLRRLVIECNRKKGLGGTLHGTRRARARTSGFRTRLKSRSGKKVIAARRKKGRHTLAPGSLTKKNGKK